MAIARIQVERGARQGSRGSMTKIKNFRVYLRPREMARSLKKEHGVETTPDLDMTLEQLVKESKKWVAPAAVYTTLTRPVAEKATTLALPEDAIAVSVVAVSIGPALLREIEGASADPVRQQQLQSLLQESLTQSVHFVTRLVSDQAKEEECDMSAPTSVQDPALASAIAALLGVHRIGIALENQDSTLPSFSRVSCSYWIPKGKGSARRAESSARVEKVAA